MTGFTFRQVYGADNEFPDGTALFMANKQIWAEATHHFYSSNTFAFTVSDTDLYENCWDKREYQEVALEKSPMFIW